MFKHDSPSVGDVLGYVTADYGHRKVHEISAEVAEVLLNARGYTDVIGVPVTMKRIFWNKDAICIQVEPELWVYKHDFKYYLTTPRD